MPTHVVQASRWTTAAFPDAADLLPAELKALGAHVAACTGGGSRWLGLQCAAETVHSFIARRFVTTLAVVTITFGLSALMF